MLLYRVSECIAFCFTIISEAWTEFGVSCRQRFFLLSRSALLLFSAVSERRRQNMCWAIEHICAVFLESVHPSYPSIFLILLLFVWFSWLCLNLFCESCRCLSAVAQDTLSAPTFICVHVRCSFITPSFAPVVGVWSCSQMVVFFSIIYYW